MRVAGILLAAGSASRMGHNKLLDTFEGEALVRRAARRALEAGLDPVLVVVGHEAERIREALAGLPVEVVPSPHWERGQGASVAAGAAAVPPYADAAVVLLGDMPLVTSAGIEAVVARHRETGAPIVTARYGGVTAPPTLYARPVLPELRAGEARGREVVRRHGDAVVLVDAPPEALADVDVPADLDRLRGVAGAPLARDEEILRQAAAWMDAGLGVALATVTSTWGSSLRPAGSQLAVNARGELAGSVSGGCVESAVAGEALDSLRDGRLRRLRYGITDEQAWGVGLPCGGTLEVVVKPAVREVLGRVAAEATARRPVLVAVDLASGGERVLGPGEACEPPELAEAVRTALASGRSEVRALPGGEVFLRPFVPPVRLVVVGAVHVAQALARMAVAAGLDVVVVDPRRAFATAERFPGVPLVAEWPAEALAGLGVDAHTAVVTLAHDPKIDDPALVAALHAGCFHVGALGSRRSHAARLGRLRKVGVPEADLARIHGPVGLAIGAVTPGEIATSILAQVVERLRRGPA